MALIMRQWLVKVFSQNGTESNRFYIAAKTRKGAIAIARARLKGREFFTFSVSEE